MPLENNRRTKIVCTIGPSTQSIEKMRERLLVGMDIARQNMSHGTHEYHENSSKLLRQAANDTERNLGIMIDLQGPKIRTGKLVNNQPVQLQVGKSFYITTRGRRNGRSCFYYVQAIAQ